MADPLILYSTGTWLGFIINQRYYGGTHFVWCSPLFSSNSISPYHTATPPTSTPCDIYRTLLDEVKSRDRHSVKIQQNRVGIIRGASVKKNLGEITEDQEREIIAIVNAAEVADFKPIIYVIPFRGVAGILRNVPVTDRAHPLSEEYIIEDLQDSLFDVIDFFWS